MPVSLFASPNPVPLTWVNILGARTAAQLQGALASDARAGGLGLGASQVLTAGSIYVAGACVGALFFG